MSEAQAEEFAAQYRVIAQSPESGFFGHGFSATIFQSVETGALTFAIRGTDQLADWFGTNFGEIGANGIAISQGIALFNWLQQLVGGAGNPVAQYVYHDDGTLTTASAMATGELSGLAGPMTVAGDSLGGHLAMMMSRLVPGMVSEVYTYNAPGFDRLGSTESSEFFFELLRNAPIGPITGPIATAWNADIMSHAYVDGDIVHDIGTVPGEQREVFSENANEGPIDAHSIKAITDALAVYDLLARLDPDLNGPAVGLPILTDILKATSARPEQSAEKALDALREVFLGANIPSTPQGNRETFYDNYYALKSNSAYDALAGDETTPGTADIRPFFNPTTSQPFSTSQLLALAAIPDGNGYAYRYALKELNPFAVLGADYSQHNQGGALELYDETSRTGTFTADWLADRSAFLANLMVANTADSTAFNQPWLQSNGEAVYFEDRASGEKLYLTPNTASVELNLNEGNQHLPNFLFGGDSADNLTGDDRDDILFAGAGHDILRGGDGSDYLEGGAGIDSYYYTAGDGSDTILDTDGRGGIFYFDANGELQTLTAGLREADDPEGQYQSEDGTVTYQINDTELQITTPDGGTITVRDFDRDQHTLGIQLLDLPATPTGLTRTGSSTNDVGLFDTRVPVGVAGSGVMDGGTPGPDIISSEEAIPLWAHEHDSGQYSGTVYSVLQGQGGADLLVGNAGGSQVLLDGGEGDDWLIADHNFKTSYFHSETDYTSDASGATLLGGEGHDALLGGYRSDVLDGGAGHDQLIGDLDTETVGDAGSSMYLSLATARGDDYLVGGLGNDWLSGGNEADILIGGPDETQGETDDDFLLGGSGSDSLAGGAGADTLYGDAHGGFARQLVEYTTSYHTQIVAWNGATQTHHLPDFLLNGAPRIGWLYTDSAAPASDVIEGGAGDDAARTCLPVQRLRLVTSRHTTHAMRRHRRSKQNTITHAQKIFCGPRTDDCLTSLAA